MDSLFQDLRFGARMLLRAPGISLAVILTLALGIGADSSMFSLVDALVLRALPYRDPSKLAVIWDRDAQGVQWGASAANFIDWRKRTKSFTEIAAWTPASFVLTGLDRPSQINGASVTANFFRTLGVTPLLGRTFLPDEDGIDNPANAARSAIVSYRMWQDLLGADPNVLGRSIELDRVTYAVVGVMRPEFVFRFTRHQVWVPAVLDRNNRDFHYLTSFGRLTPQRAVAGAEMQSLAQALAQEHPKSNRGWSIVVDDLEEFLVVSHAFRQRLLILFAAVGMVLLIACTNVASLLLARASARGREIALRMSLGATRFRLVRQLWTESMLLALVGGGLGLLLARLSIAAAPSIIPPALIPAGVTIELNASVLAFTLAASVLTGMIFGMAPALMATRGGAQEALKDSARGSTGGGTRQRFRQAMVVLEVALALVLLAGAGLMAGSLRGLTTIDLGFNPHNVLSLRLVLPARQYSAERALQLQQELLRRIKALPGVENAIVASNLPLSRVIMDVPFDLETAPPKEQAERPGAGYTSVSAGFVATLGARLLRGRDFLETDQANAPPVAIVNKAFAARYFPGQNPVGQRIILNRPILGKNGFEDDLHVEIVGLIGNMALNDAGAPPRPLLYAPQAQNLWRSTAYFAVRGKLDPVGLTSAIRTEMADLAKDQPVEDVTLLERNFTDQFAQPRFQSQVMGAFALISFVLAIVGIYGVNSYAVAQRKREIGVRMALGATPTDILSEVLGRGMALTGAGIALGLTGAMLLGPAMRSVLIGIGSADPPTLVAAAGLLAFVAAVACCIPAYRAARVHPATALRQD